jgi:hypothetical protein
MNSDTVMARSAIESLRSGVPSRHVAALLGTTQEAVKTRFDESLLALTENQGTQPLIFAANFGTGKSHLLNYLRCVAEQQGFVTSYVVVSPEMPVGNAPVVLKAIAESSHAPGRMGKALSALAPDLSVTSPAFQRLREWAREASLSGRTQALLRIYEEYRADTELRAQILEDFEGKTLPIGVIRYRLHEMKEAAAYDLTTPKVARAVLLRQQARERIQLLSQFYRACGCKGWVILFDEVELLAKFSANQRSLAYQELGWWAESAEQEGSGIVPVFAFVEAFVNEVLLGGKRDAQKFAFSGASLETDEREARITRGIEVLKRPMFLTSSLEQEEEIKYRIKGIYEQAYGIRVPNLLPQKDVRTTIRSDIRRWITLWDFHRHDPTYIPQVEMEDLAFDQSEEFAEEIITADESEANE